MKNLLRYAALAGFLVLSGCPASSSPPPDTGSTAQVQTARQEVFAASAAVAGIAATVLSAHQTGLLGPGVVEKDIQAGLDAARFSLDKANASLKSGDAGGATFYASQVADLLAGIKKQLFSLGVEA